MNRKNNLRTIGLFLILLICLLRIQQFHLLNEKTIISLFLLLIALLLSALGNYFFYKKE